MFFCLIESRLQNGQSTNWIINLHMKRISIKKLFKTIKKSCKLVCSIEFLLNWFWAFYIQPLQTQSKGGRAPTDGTFLHFSHLLPCWVSVRSTSGLIKKQLVAAAAVFLDVNIADRAEASAAVICRWVITSGPLPGFGRLTTVTWPTHIQDKIKEIEKYNLCLHS